MIDEHGGFADALVMKSFQSPLGQSRADALTAVIPMDDQVMQGTAAAVMACHDRPDDLPVFFFNETGLGIALQITADPFPGIIDIIEIDTGSRTPQLMDSLMILQSHQTHNPSFFR